MPYYWLNIIQKGLGIGRCNLLLLKYNDKPTMQTKKLDLLTFGCIQNVAWPNPICITLEGSLET